MRCVLGASTQVSIVRLAIGSQWSNNHLVTHAHHPPPHPKKKRSLFTLIIIWLYVLRTRHDGAGTIKNQAWWNRIYKYRSVKRTACRWKSVKRTTCRWKSGINLYKTALIWNVPIVNYSVQKTNLQLMFQFSFLY